MVLHERSVGLRLCCVLLVVVLFAAEMTAGDSRDDRSRCAVVQGRMEGLLVVAAAGRGRLGVGDGHERLSGLALHVRQLRHDAPLLSETLNPRLRHGMVLQGLGLRLVNGPGGGGVWPGQHRTVAYEPLSRARKARVGGRAAPATGLGGARGGSP